MSVIQSLKETSAKATRQGEHYLETSKHYFELKVFQQLTLGLSFLIKTVVVGGLLFLALIFLLVGATIALGHYIDSMAMSALLIAFVLTLCAAIGYTMRKKMDRKIIEKVAVEFFED